MEAFYDGMPDAIGFANGYVQSHTFTVKDKRPLISYDYYLAPESTEDQVVADLEELPALTETDPIFSSCTCANPAISAGEIDPGPARSRVRASAIGRFHEDGRRTADLSGAVPGKIIESPGRIVN